MKISYLGETHIKRNKVRFGIKDTDRAHHTYIVGKTGTGKSTLLRNMILQDIAQGYGVGVIDPHGDLVESLLDHIPDRRVNETVYFNASDLDFPFGFNPLKHLDPERKHLSVSMLVGSLKTLWHSSWGPRLEYLLFHTLSLLSVSNESTLLGVERVLKSAEFREHLLSQTNDSYLQNFWRKEFAGFHADSFLPILNKVGGILSRAPMRNILGQSKAKFQPSISLMKGQVLLVNLSKGQIGKDSAKLLGALLLASLEMSSFSQEVSRKPFNLYIDEFQNFGDSAIPSLLSESRKFNLRLILAHQYLDQLSRDFHKAILGNVGTTIAFRAGYADALKLSKEFGIFPPEDFTNLDRFQILLRLSIDSVTSSPFLAKTLPPLSSRFKNGDKVRRSSRERFGKTRERVEVEIDNWFRQR